MKRLLIPAAMAFTIAFGGAASADPLGEWRVADGTATVQIKKCGANLCGYVASTSTPAGKDEKNPDPSKRSRSVLGIEVLINLKPEGNNIWSGITYNAEDGQLYTAKVSMKSEAALQIQGCVPNGGLCGSETWSRVK
ncbi:MAG TPA: DUF2147 domain-containing protein [Beijerinckia sp.]|jgi:uncharacterized protein (DUF2147 family)|nr:DUF2147 domain-containing protein [Beijerinckia sp.]